MKKFLSLLLVALLLAPAAPAKWIAFDRSPGASHNPAYKADGSPAHFTVDVAIPGMEVIEKDGYTFVYMPGTARRMVKDEPELPLLTTSILLPDQGQPQVKLEVLDETVVEVGKIAPSKGHLTRDIPYDSVPFNEGPVYKKDALYPAAEYTVEVDKPYICRDVRGTAVRICPFKYNPVEGKLHVIKAARLDVTMTRGGFNEKNRLAPVIDSAFAPLYKKLYVNFALATKNWTDIDETQGRAIILCPDKWVDNLAPLQEWRATKGLESKVVSTSQILSVVDPDGDAKGQLTGELLKQYIKSEYDAGNLTWVLLVGDADEMPPLRGVYERAHSDGRLVMLEGDDNIPDAFISRFSCKTAEQLDVQVARAIAYEKNPVTGEDAAFYRKAVGIASNQGNPTDYERADWLRDIELGWNYDLVDQIYDPSATAAKVAAAINEGRGLINYIGHGSKSMWVSSRFNVDDVEELTNTGGKWPMIWSVACVNGDFAYGADCFAEAWAKAGTPEAPTGCIGMVAASTNMAWVPPCVWQKAIIEDYLVTEQVFTGGAMHHYGCLKACEEYGYGDHSSGVQIVEQCNYFGDSSVVLRTDIPKEATVSVVQKGKRSLSLKVTAGDKPVKAARVVLSTELQGGLVGTTDENGVVEFQSSSDLSAVEGASVTVTGPNLIPVINEAIELSGE